VKETPEAQNASAAPRFICSRPSSVRRLTNSRAPTTRASPASPESPASRERCSCRPPGAAVNTDRSGRSPLRRNTPTPPTTALPRIPKTRRSTT
jgi:hypothetical protein